jgi:uroporphyrinogen decarboxylase
MSMSSRERVLCALQHEQPDHVPVVIGVSNATGIKMKPYRDIKQLIGVEAPDRYLYDWPELGTAEIDEATMRRLHSDVRGVLDLEPDPVRRRNRERPPHADCIDSWGSGQREIGPNDWYPGVHPLAEAQSTEDLDRYAHWPDMSDPTRIAHVREQARRLADEGEYAVMATPWLLFPFERAHAMQGLDNFLVNMVVQPDFAQALLERIAGHCKELMGHFLRECGEFIDIIKIGDDLGTQERLMISPEMYRRFLKPVHEDFIRFIKQRTGARVFFHSDGDVAPLIDDFIEIGVDILNPIQTSAGSMANLAELKRRYGKNIVFCGGIDTHRILPHGSPAEVREEVRRVVEVLGPGGGYLLGAVHTVMNDVPAENVLAMVDAAAEFGGAGQGTAGRF